MNPSNRDLRVRDPVLRDSEPATRRRPYDTTTMLTPLLPLGPFASGTRDVESFTS